MYVFIYVCMCVCMYARMCVCYMFVLSVDMYKHTCTCLYMIVLQSFWCTTKKCDTCLSSTPKVLKRGLPLPHKQITRYTSHACPAVNYAQWWCTFTLPTIGMCYNHTTTNMLEMVRKSKILWQQQQQQQYTGFRYIMTQAFV